MHSLHSLRWLRIIGTTEISGTDLKHFLLIKAKPQGFCKSKASQNPRRGIPHDAVMQPAWATPCQQKAASLRVKPCEGTQVGHCNCFLTDSEQRNPSHVQPLWEADWEQGREQEKQSVGKRIAFVTEADLGVRFEGRSSSSASERSPSHEHQCISHTHTHRAQPHSLQPHVTESKKKPLHYTIRPQIAHLVYQHPHPFQTEVINTSKTTARLQKRNE